MEPLVLSRYFFAFVSPNPRPSSPPRKRERFQSLDPNITYRENRTKYHAMKRPETGLEIEDRLRYNQCVEIKFEWDPAKEKINIHRHGIPFSEAATVFGDPLSWTFPDADHSIGEYRYLTIGMSSLDRILMVSHVDRSENIRLISARKATRRERKYYEEER